MNRSVLRRASILILLGIVAGAGWYFFSDSNTDVTNFPSKGTDIIAFGDSLVAGNGSTEGHDFVSLVSQKIGQPITNLGVPGNTTADGLARIHEIDQYHPKVVLLLLGGNDHLKRVPIETTFQNLGSLIAYIHAKGAIVFLLGVKGNLFGDQFAPEFEVLHEKYRTAYLPNVLEGLFGDTEFMADSIHPNDAGYAVIADRIYPLLLPLLQ
jgi:acyl-CoA thioesterase I